ncbi:hypothetical protein BGZ61DRAFT_447448 [Ilyonectria robusta]|uniref:uncharacterized protein n=1 Tax=Ilyonectria robusta TaxID=1079257 RepID=UPI001E8CB1B3|nr:uncharacterized protein BGZ61DRAFT_447448 [Ilyonectria robusta]KAH8721789.1 hypothetical protein BGZ61DRAFT_447448 [Ilyonectria robusta]
MQRAFSPVREPRRSIRFPPSSEGLGDAPTRHKPIYLQVAIDNLPTSLPGCWFTLTDELIRAKNSKSAL